LKIGICYSALVMKLPQKCQLRSSLASILCLVGLFGPSCVVAQQSAPPLAAPDSAARAEFTAATDEVLGQMSEITGLKLRSPLKRSLRSRDEIRAYVIRQMNEDKTPAERYAETRSAEAFALLPKGFDLDSFMVDLLTEQIAGLYDPKTQEFYIADWIPLEEQRMVMAHELTHALQDQHFKIEAWMKAARPNDDAELAREAVLEGSAMAAMLDYTLREKGLSLRDLPDIDLSALVGDMAGTPSLQKAPPFIKDSLIFPYFAGLTFSNALLKPSGWTAISNVFANPPASTQQILHPSLYHSGKKPAVLDLPVSEAMFGPNWSKLEDNILGEFGWNEVLKQFLGEDRANVLSAAWEGDRYMLFEQQRSKRLVLITRLRLSSAERASRFFGQYSEALEKKYPQRSNLFRRPNFFSFDSPEGGVFLHCAEAECITLEGADRAAILTLNKDLGWGPLPEPSQDLATPRENTTQRRNPFPRAVTVVFQ
jgi:hypothetical protein